MRKTRSTPLPVGKIRRRREHGSRQSKGMVERWVTLSGLEARKASQPSHPESSFAFTPVTPFNDTYVHLKAGSSNANICGTLHQRKRGTRGILNSKNEFETPRRTATKLEQWDLPFSAGRSCQATVEYLACHGCRATPMALPGTA